MPNGKKREGKWGQDRGEESKKGRCGVKLRWRGRGRFGANSQSEQGQRKCNQRCRKFSECPKGSCSGYFCSWSYQLESLAGSSLQCLPKAIFWIWGLGERKGTTWGLVECWISCQKLSLSTEDKRHTTLFEHFHVMEIHIQDPILFPLISKVQDQAKMKAGCLVLDKF